MEIGTYIHQNLTSELSGNIVDLCPVGALTSKPYQFKGRPWELKNVESIDLSDGVGSNIRIDTRGNELMRVLPRMNNAINEEWISDKTRHAVVDGSQSQRLDYPLKKDTNWGQISWQKMLSDLTDEISCRDGNEVAFYIDSGSTDLETMSLVKDLAQRIGCPNVFTYSGVHGSIGLDPTFRSDYTCDFTKLEQADVCLLVGVNPRKEAAMLNVRLRRRVLKGELLLASVGLSEHLTYPVAHLGSTSSVLLQILEGRHTFCKVLAVANSPVVLLSAEGNCQLVSAIQQAMSHFLPNASVQVLHGTANGAGALDLGISHLYGFSGHYKLVYVLGGLASANHQLRNVLASAHCVIYQGSHGQNLPNLKYVVPAAASAIEKQGLFVNTEGRVQETKVAVTFAKEDWKILRALISSFNEYGRRSLQEIRGRLISEVVPHVGKMHDSSITSLRSTRTKPMTVRWLNHNLVPAVLNFYQTDSFSSASKVMADCTKMIRENSHNYTRK